MAQTKAPQALDGGGVVEERWRAEVGGCDAMAADSEVVVAVTEAEMVALDSETGAIWWTVAVEGGDDVELAVCAGVVHFGSASSERTIDVRSGLEVDPPKPWPDEALGQADVGMDGSVLEFYAEEGGIVAIDAESGDERWWAPLDEEFLVAVGFADIVLVNGSRGLHVLAAKTGEPVAMVAAESADTSPSAQILCSGGRVFAGLADGWLVCLDMT